MAKKTVNAKGTQVVRDFGDVDMSQGQPAEVVVDQGTDNDEVVYEGGDLDGKRGAEAAEDQDLLKKVEQRRAELNPPKTPEADLPKDPEVDLPELETEETPPDPKVVETGETPPAAETTEEEAPAYTPNLKYKAYGQEKDFPEWAKGVVTSPEVEGEMRTLFAKADGLDGMVPKHQQALSERDTFKAGVDEHVGRVQRLIELRDKAPGQFFEELGVSKDMVLRHARQIVEAEENPALAQAYASQREAERLRYAIPVAPPPAQLDPVVVTLHTQEMTRTLSQPEVKGYSENFDKLHGEGAFQRQVNTYGEQVYRTQKGKYVAPSDAAAAVMSHFGEAFKKSAPAPAPAAPGSAAPAARTAGTPRPKVVPRVGHGANASPTVKRLTSLDEVKKRVAAELND